MLNFIKPLILLASIVLLLPNSAFAYLDPGSGSMIFQGLVAAIFSGLFLIKTYWRKILRALGLKKDDDSNESK